MMQKHVRVYPLKERLWDYLRNFSLLDVAIKGLRGRANELPEKLRDTYIQRVIKSGTAFDLLLLLSGDVALTDTQQFKAVCAYTLKSQTTSSNIQIDNSLKILQTGRITYPPAQVELVDFVRNAMKADISTLVSARLRLSGTYESGLSEVLDYWQSRVDLLPILEETKGKLVAFIKDTRISVKAAFAQRKAEAEELLRQASEAARREGV